MKVFIYHDFAVTDIFVSPAMPWAGLLGPFGAENNVSESMPKGRVSMFANS